VGQKIFTSSPAQTTTGLSRLSALAAFSPTGSKKAAVPIVGGGETPMPDVDEACPYCGAREGERHHAPECNRAIAAAPGLMAHLLALIQGSIDSGDHAEYLLEQLHEAGYEVVVADLTSRGQSDG
jgi:hypothetical protein